VAAGPREQLLYLPCIYRNTGSGIPDFLATVDVDPKSPQYCQVVHRLPMPHVGDELHHSGWNACSSCHGDPQKSRDFLILPSLLSSRIYIVDVATDPRAPRLHKVVEAEQLALKANAAFPHTSHCLGSGEILISCLGDPQGNGKGTFILLDGETFEVKGNWEKGGKIPELGYDFWYQPRHNVLLSTEWGVPRALQQGFNPQDVQKGLGKIKKNSILAEKSKKNPFFTVKIFLITVGLWIFHEFGEIWEFWVNNLFFFLFQEGKWEAEKVIEVPSKKVQGWLLPEMPGGRNLGEIWEKFGNFLTDPEPQILQLSHERQKLKKIPQKFHFLTKFWDFCPKTWEFFLKICDLGFPGWDFWEFQGKRIPGGPQMLQLSLDGRRLYVTTSLFSAWDRQFYPEMIK
ncbi:SBP1 oxidase, partial [Oenanthe oenanthe]|nr:SBP1 oxidase [Oenanthe oenanthe]